jgi:hypothetical protein
MIDSRDHSPGDKRHDARLAITLSGKERSKTIMKIRRIRLVGTLAVLAMLTQLAGCASFHGSPNGPGDCVGPPDFCVPFFGS